MRTFNKHQVIVTALVILSAVSCRVGQLYKTPQAPANDLFRGVTGSDTNTIADIHWQDMFTDSLLRPLIAQGIANNLDLKVAYARVRQAQAYFRQSAQAFLPSVNATATAALNAASNTTVAGSNAGRNQFQLLADANWEIDVWGKLQSNKRANLAAFFQEEANARAVQTSIVAGIAAYYYQLLALDQQLRYTRESVVNWQKTVDVMKELKKADVVTGAAIVQSEASKYAVEATIPDLERSIRETENGLNQLMGHAPAAVQRTTVFVQPTAALLQTGLPAQLLANRPDVQAAEYNFRYYFELTNVARAYFYPSLTLSASGGYLTAGNLWSPGSWIAGIAAGLTQPIFNQRVNKTRLEVAREQQQQYLWNFQNTLITAGREVSDALYAHQAATSKTNARDSQLVNLHKSVEYTQQLVRYGFANYTEVLNAQLSLLNGQLSQVNDRLQQLEAIVQLYKALGGGWK